MLGLSWAGCLCWYSRLLLQFSISGNDIEARVGGDYPVIKCVCREIWSVCIKCFWLSAKVSVQRLGEGSSLPFLFYWRWEWMSLLDSMVISIFSSNGSYLIHITTRWDCRGILVSWHLDLCSFSPGLNGRNWEEGRRRPGGKASVQVWCFITCHWCSPYILQLFCFLPLNKGLNKGTCLKEFRATNLETSIYQDWFSVCIIKSTKVEPLTLKGQLNSMIRITHRLKYFLCSRPKCRTSILEVTKVSLLL